MKKNTIFILALLCSSISYSQTYQYHFFPETLGYWKYKIFSDNIVHIGWESHEYNIDTVSQMVWGTHYKYYETNKKIFAKHSSDTAFKVLYDFNLTVGDTFHNPFYEPGLSYPSELNDVVISDDSLGFGTPWLRRTIKFSNGVEWVEGVGNISGWRGIEHPLNLYTLSGGIRIECVYSDTSSFPCPDAYALALDKNEEIPRPFYPNPTSQILKIDQRIVINEILRVHNTLGENVSDKVNIHFGRMEIDFGNLPSGIYYIVYRNGTKTKNEKIVKL